LRRTCNAGYAARSSPTSSASRGCRRRCPTYRGRSRTFLPRCARTTRQVEHFPTKRGRAAWWLWLVVVQRAGGTVIQGYAARSTRRYSLPTTRLLVRDQGTTEPLPGIVRTTDAYRARTLRVDFTKPAWTDSGCRAPARDSNAGPVRCPRDRASTICRSPAAPRSASPFAYRAA
jgi:hypothetical protein